MQDLSKTWIGLRLKYKSTFKFLFADLKKKNEKKIEKKIEKLQVVSTPFSVIGLVHYACHFV